MVCGFGFDFNMVILNGRIMLGFVLLGGGGVLNFCVFDFFDLVLESVCVVEVYKIGCVSIVIGGIGVLINICILCLFDVVEIGFIVSVGVKVLIDIINCVGDDVIFEVLGMINFVSDDEIFGFIFIGLFQ